MYPSDLCLLLVNAAQVSGYRDLWHPKLIPLLWASICQHAPLRRRLRRECVEHLPGPGHAAIDTDPPCKCVLIGGLDGPIFNRALNHNALNHTFVPGGLLPSKVTD